MLLLLLLLLYLVALLHLTLCILCIKLQDFFLNVKDILRKPEVTTPAAHNYHELEKELQEK